MASNQDHPPALGPLLAGSLAVFAGSATGLWAPGPIAAIIGLLTALRLCWIDENIRHDLERADRVPAGYARVLSRRRQISTLLFGTQGDEITCPRLLASHMRAQGHAYFAFLFGLLATFLASGAEEAPAAFVLAAGALALALRRVDRLVAANALLRQGRPLPAEMLDDRGTLSRMVLNHPAREPSPERRDDDATQGHRRAQDGRDR